MLYSYPLTWHVATFKYSSILKHLTFIFFWSTAHQSVLLILYMGPLTTMRHLQFQRTSPLRPYRFIFIPKLPRRLPQEQ